jgi:hypothetical protein
MSFRNQNLNFIVNALKAIGAPMPPALTNALDERKRIHEAVSEFRGTGYAGLAEAWANVILDGRDPAEDREVFRAVLTSTLAGGGDLERAAGNAVDARAERAVSDMHADLLKQFKKAFDKAGKTMRDAHEILGRVSLDDTTAIFQLGPVAVKAHQDAQEARRIVRVINMGWEGVNAIANIAPPTIERATRWADSDIDTWERTRRLKDGWDMTTAGVTLDLAIDNDTIRARQERLNTEREERDTRPDREEREARRALGAIWADAYQQ